MRVLAGSRLVVVHALALCCGTWQMGRRLLLAFQLWASWYASADGFRTQDYNGQSRKRNGANCKKRRQASCSLGFSRFLCSWPKVDPKLRLQEPHAQVVDRRRRDSMRRRCALGKYSRIGR
ncbi:hypothetical protein BJ170DRAFT_355768 [Xylariales sp. AK1849]|nr:hypothetical protein BJ170DRAFT_355768 [Xylariales sp. AK1849]